MSVTTFLSNTLVLGVLEAAPLILAVIGFTIIFRLNGFTNVAYAENLTIGGYVGVMFNTIIGWNFYLSIIPAALVSGLVSVLTFLLIFRPAFKRGVGSNELIILSMGISYFLRHALRAIYGTIAYAFQFNDQAYLKVFGIGITSVQVICIGLAIALAVGLYLFMYRTNYGITMRALADNETLAKTSGINPLKVSVLVWFIAGVAGGLAGVFLTTFSYANYILGWNFILIIIMVSIVGGVGNVRGGIIASIIAGVITTAVVLLMNHDLYGDIVTLLLFIVLLKLRKVRA